MKTKITRSNIIKNLFKNKLYLFMLIGSIAISLLIPFTVQKYVVPSFYAELLDSTLDDAKKVGKHIARHQNEDVKSTVFYTALDELKDDFNIYKIRLFDTKGEIVFSTKTSEVGTINTNDYYFDIVAKGKIFYKLVQKNQKSKEGETLLIDVIEIYVPIMVNNSFAGSSEIYYNITDKKAKFEELINNVNFFYNIFALLFLATSFTVIYILSKHNLKELETEQLLQNKINEKTTELQEINKNLELRIKDEVEKNREKESKLFQQSKLAAMGEMIGNIAHQWRQPLSAITSSASSIKLENELGLLEHKDINDMMEGIIHKANFLSDTIENFRNFFKVNNKKIEFNLTDSILKVEKIVESNYKNENITIIHDFQDKGISIKALEGEFSQVILNILNNAFDNFVEKRLEDRYVKISTICEDEIIKVNITDNGGGIPDNIIKKIFEPYFTTKHQTQGTGIGLYMCSEIIHKHFNGTFVVNNEKWEIDNKAYTGATFTITFNKTINI